jgi:hypothetical protein
MSLITNKVQDFTNNDLTRTRYLFNDKSCLSQGHKYRTRPLNSKRECPPRFIYSIHNDDGFAFYMNNYNDDRVSEWILNKVPDDNLDDVSSQFFDESIVHNIEIESNKKFLLSYLNKRQLSDETKINLENKIFTSILESWDGHVFRFCFLVDNLQDHFSRVKFTDEKVIRSIKNFLNEFQDEEVYFLQDRETIDGEELYWNLDIFIKYILEGMEREGLEINISLRNLLDIGNYNRFNCRKCEKM